MQNDDITWSILNRRNCAFKIKTETKNFCRNEYNVTGLCMRKACPLANSQYATVREKKGIVYLYIRYAENVYTPNKEWKQIKLSKNFIEALQQIEDNLVFWPKYYITKCRQRFTKITQYLARMRKMQLTSTKKLVPVRQKDERRMTRREEKALIAAKLDNEIEKQLLNRLKQGTYERIYNFPKQTFENLLDEEEELEEEVEELNEENGEKIRVKEEMDEMEDEEMDADLRKELERGVVRIERGEDDSDADSDDYNDSDIEQAAEGDSDEEFEEDDYDEESGEDEEAEEESGQVEYVADFDESEDEDEPEMDIEDISERLGLSAPEPSSRKRGPTVSKYTGDKPLEGRDLDEYTDMKYNASKNMTTNQKLKLKRRKAKQKLKEFAEKELKSREKSAGNKVVLKK